MNCACTKYLTVALLLGAAILSPAQLVNGNFQTGDLTGWTVFDDPDGDTGGATVVLFDTAGTGTPCFSAQFEAGCTIFPTGEVPGYGGGISQNVTLGAGQINIRADIAAYEPGSTGNGDAGTFEFMLDGSALATNNLGFINYNQTICSNLTYCGAITAGTHEFAVHVSRAFLWDEGDTPYQYVANVVLTVTSLQPPISLDIQKRGSAVVLSWTNSAFSLQSAPSPTGAFTNLPAASSPFTNAISGPAQYFRLTANE